MAVVALKSTAITNATATPRVMNHVGNDYGNVRRSQGLAVVTNGDSIGSTYRVCRVHSSDFADSIRLYSPDIGTTTVTDVGLYQTDDNGGAVVDADFFASAVSLKDGALNGSELVLEAGAAGGSIANAEKRIWEALGLASDPGRDYDLTLTLTAAADATGTVLVRYYGVQA